MEPLLAATDQRQSLRSAIAQIRNCKGCLSAIDTPIKGTGCAYRFPSLPKGTPEGGSISCRQGSPQPVRRPLPRAVRGLRLSYVARRRWARWYGGIRASAQPLHPGYVARAVPHAPAGGTRRAEGAQHGCAPRRRGADRTSSRAFRDGHDQGRWRGDAATKPRWRLCTSCGTARSGERRLRRHDGGCAPGASTSRWSRYRDTGASVWAPDHTRGDGHQPLQGLPNLESDDA